jgi:hypothetical protein
MKKVLFATLLLAFSGTGVFSQALYSSTAYTSRFNPGVGANGTPIVAYDDVSIPTSSATGSDSISITQIKVGIRRVPNAPATTVSIYYSAFQDGKGSVNKTPENILLGKVSLPVNGSSLVTSVIALGDSATALLRIKKDTSMACEGFQKILIGASFDNPSSGNGIVLTKEESKNLDSIWVVNPDTDKMLYATNFQGRLPASYYLEVFGSGADDSSKEERNLIAGILHGDNSKAISRR